MELERPLKLNLNSIILIVQLVFAGGAAAAFFSNSYADYRRDAETIAALKLEVAELKKVDRDFGVKLSDSQLATATRLIGIERDVDYIKKTVERLEKAVTAPAPR